MSGQEPYVIVGAGQAGAWIARTLRSEGYDGDIVLIGNEQYAPYERPPLSKGVLIDGEDLDQFTVSTRDELKAASIVFQMATGVQSIEPESKSVLLGHEQKIPYKKLFLATGGRPLTLPLHHGLLDRVLTLRSYDDALALKNMLRPDLRVGVIGGGWIGLEVAASARRLGCDVMLFEAADQLCGRTLPSKMAAWLQARHETNGVSITCNAHVERISSYANQSVNISLSDGKTETVDILIIAVGMTPNDGLARNAGLQCDRGIVVDTACHTSAPDIFAAGDVAALDSTRYSRRMRFESWQNAQDQAIAAAKSALGISVSYDPIPKIWSEQGDLMIRCAGIFDAADTIIFRDDDSGPLCLGVDEKGRLKGLASVNRMRDHRMLLKAMEKDAIVDSTKLLNTDCAPLDALVA